MKVIRLSAKFGIAALDVGFLKWILGEVLRLSRILHWYLGEEIEAEEKKNN